MEDQIKAMFAKVSAANPAIEAYAIAYYPSHVKTLVVYCLKHDAPVCANSFDELCEKLAAIKIESEEEKTRRELLELENKANELRKKLGVE